MKLAFAAQMKEMDRVAIEERGIPSLDLMERAAEEIADVVEELTEVQESSAGREKRLFCRRQPVKFRLGTAAGRGQKCLGRERNASLCLSDRATMVATEWQRPDC